MVGDRNKATLERTFPTKGPDPFTRKKVHTWHSRWHRYHPETRQWHARVAAQLAEYGYVEETFSGRKRYFPGGAAKENAPTNHQIQSFSAGVTNDAILRICEEIPFRLWSPWSGMMIQVHDQLVACVPESRAEEAKKIFERCMYHEIECADGSKLPITATAVIAKDWGRAE